MIAVIRTPFPSVLPNGTEIVRTEPRKGKTGNWFKRADGTILFGGEPEDADGKFKLWPNEFKEEK